MIYSQMLKKLVLPIADKAMNTTISSTLKQIRDMREFTGQDIEEWQHHKIMKLIHHAYTHTRYYKKVFDQYGINPAEINTRTDLSKLPVLTKKDIRENFQDLVPVNIQSIPYKKSATGGSTGDPLKYYLDRKSWSYIEANKIYNWEKAGYNYGDKFIALGSTSLYVEKKHSIKHSLYYKLKNKIGLNGINMSDQVCREYADLLRKKKIRFIYGYATSIYLLAKYVIENNEKLNIQACFSTSEKLTEQYRVTIKKAFDCKIVDCYGARDGGITTFAHDEGAFEVGYNCIVRLDKKNDKNSGPALLTDLLNYAMPLINYKLGDELLIDNDNNKGYDYNGQVINKVIGRTSDVIQLENGSILTGPGFTILFKDLPVDYYCIEKIGDNAIKCHIKKLPEYTSVHESLIISTFKKHMGTDSKFSIVYNDDIKYTKSGKRKYFIS